jgi:hypothetical protein
MSDYHNTHWVEFFPKSRFSAPVFTAINCMTFDALSHLTGPNANLFFATNRCFVCHHSVHCTESCPQCSLGMLFCKRLDDPHRKSICYVLTLLMMACRMGCSLFGLTAARKQEAEWKEREVAWATAPTNSDSGWDIPKDDSRCLDWQDSDVKLVTTMHAVSCGWPSIEGGIEVSVEVRSNTGDLAEEHTACRCFVFVLICPFNLISHLYYSSVGTSDGSCTSFGSHRGADLFVISEEYVA